MAVNPQIPLGVRTAQLPTPSAAISTLLGNQQKQAELEAAKAAREAKEREEADVTKAFGQYTLADGSPDFDAIVNHLAPLYPNRAMALKKEVADGRIKAAEALDKQTAGTLGKFKAGVAILQGIETPEDYQARLPLLRQLSPEVADALGAEFDPGKVERLMAIGLTQQQVLTERRAALQAWSQGNTDGGFLRYLKTAQSNEEYQNILLQGRAMGVPKPIVDSVPTQWSPQVAEQIASMSLTAKDEAAQENIEADDERLDASAAETRRHNLAMEGNANAREARLGRPGVPGAGGLTSAQRQSAMTWRANQLANPAGRGPEWVERQYRELIHEPVDDAKEVFNPTAGRFEPKPPGPDWNRTPAQSLTPPSNRPDINLPRETAGRPPAKVPAAGKPQVAVGSIVVRNGKRYRIDKIHPDETVEATLVP